MGTLMDTLTGLIQSGRIIDIILVLVAVEGLLLALLYKGTGRGLPPSRLIANLAAGASLLLATRAALMDAGVLAIAGLLFLSLVAHVWDLAMRWT